MTKSIYTNEELQYIKDNYKDRTYREITDYLNTFNKIKKNEKQVRTKAYQLGLGKRKAYDRKYFHDINNESKAYWLGFFYADGWISTSSDSSFEIGIELSGVDKSHLEKFKDELNGDVMVSTLIKKDRYIKGVFVEGGKPSALIRLFSKEMFDDLKLHNFTTDKTHSLKFPIVNSELWVPFLRGFYDGDGCLSKTEKTFQVNFTNPNYKFLEYIKNKLSNVGIRSSIHKEFDLKYRLVITKSHNMKFLEYIYQDSNIHLDRKYDKYIKILA